MKLEQKLDEALARRTRLAEARDTQCFRVVNGAGDGLSSFTLDRFSDVGVLSLYEDLSPEAEATLADAVQSRLHFRALYLKRRPKEARKVAQAPKDALAPETAFRGEDVPELSVLESGLTFVIRPGQGLAVGLYLDMRRPRAWLREHAAGKSVLNAFAYTCAFGVYATAGGASRVLNVDLSRKSLEWGTDNARANGQSVTPRDFLAGDVFDWLGRFSRKAERFDLVVLDPPSFAKSNKGKRAVFSAATDYPRLVTLAAGTVARGGVLFAACNLAKLTPDAFGKQLRTGVHEAGRRMVSLTALAADPTDFPAPAGEPPSLKVMACRLD